MTERPLLLDTCAALWLADGELGKDAEDLFKATLNANLPVLVSPITAWEVGILVSKKRITLSATVSAWFASLTSLGIDLAELPPDVLIAATELQAPELRDPADRIIAATARAFNYRVMTRDRPLLRFASSGAMQAAPC